jgi:asparaginyl-tRNA synthetase
MTTPRIRDLLASTPGSDAVHACGWVRTRRDSRNVCFIELNDGSSMQSLQVVAGPETQFPVGALDTVVTGASIAVEGTLVASPGKNQAVELAARTIAVVGTAPVDSYPLQKKRHSFEFLREIAHLRPRTNTFGAVMRVRNVMSFAIHEFFQGRGFLYINTPIITASDTEGAGEMFQVTTLPLEQVPRLDDGAVDYRRDFFGRKTSLTVSGQLEAEALALALRDVYTFGPTFRAENSNTTRHLAEFWMIEPEMAFCDIEGNMQIAEQFLKFIFREVLEKCPEDMAFFDKWVQPGIVETVRGVVDADFVRISYSEAVERLEKSEVSFEYPVSWGKDLQSEHERYLTETVYRGPVIVTDYPKQIKAFYMKQNDDGKTVRGMDVLVPRLGEIIGGSERESDYEKLLSRIRELGYDERDYGWYLDLRRFGTVPHAGFGLGFERLIQYITGIQNIRDVIPFPRTVGSAEF